MDIPIAWIFSVFALQKQTKTNQQIAFQRLETIHESLRPSMRSHHL
jgi:hypothetical protein